MSSPKQAVTKASGVRQKGKEENVVKSSTPPSSPRARGPAAAPSSSRSPAPSPAKQHPAGPQQREQRSPVVSPKQQAPGKQEPASSPRSAGWLQWPAYLSTGSSAQQGTGPDPHKQLSPIGATKGASSAPVQAGRSEGPAPPGGSSAQQPVSPSSPGLLSKFFSPSSSQNPRPASPSAPKLSFLSLFSARSPAAGQQQSQQPDNGFVLPSAESGTPTSITPPVSSRAASPRPPTAGSGSLSAPTPPTVQPKQPQPPSKAASKAGPSAAKASSPATSPHPKATASAPRSPPPGSRPLSPGAAEPKGTPTRLDASVRINLPSPVTSPTALVRGMSQKAMDSKVVRMASQTGKQAKKEVQGTLKLVRSGTFKTALRAQDAALRAQDAGLRAYDFIMGTQRPLDNDFLSRFFEDLLIYVMRDANKRDKIRDKAAVKVQYGMRMAVAKKRARRMREAAEQEELRAMSERNAEYNRRIRARFLAKKTRICVANSLARALAWESLHEGRKPLMALQIQRVWRGHVARERVKRMREHEAEMARRRRERLRARRAARERRKIHDFGMTASQRRVWARTTFKHTGWQPDGDASGLLDPFEHIWKAPKDEKQGFRIYKVKLPVTSDQDKYRIMHEKNVWVGVPIGVREVKDPPKPLGCMPRYDTKTMSLHPPEDWGKVTKPGKRFITRYNWLSTKAVSEAHLPVLTGKYQSITAGPERFCFQPEHKKKVVF